MLVSSLPLLRKAQKGKYAVGAFNVNNMEMLQAVVNAAEKERAPVIIQTTENAIKYAGLDYLVAMVRVASKTQLPVALHLDHGKNLETIKKCVKAGYTSVMFDGSKLSLKKNIEMTQKAVKIAGRKINVEGELGRIGSRKVAIENNFYTDPEEARIFVKRTGITSLAVAIGTKHGFNKGAIKLRFDILKEIRKSVSVPLVLHGSSDLKESEIGKLIKSGICKFNIDSNLRLAFTDALRKNQQEKDPRNMLGPAREAVEKVVREKIRLFRCNGKI